MGENVSTVQVSETKVQAVTCRFWIFGLYLYIGIYEQKAVRPWAFKAALRGKTCSWPFYKLFQLMLTKNLFISSVFISVSICLPAYLLSLSFYLYFISFSNWNSSLQSCCVDNGWLLNCDDPLLIRELPWITNWLPWHINQFFKSPLQGW